MDDETPKTRTHVFKHMPITCDDWLQYGDKIVCQRCSNQHAVTVPQGKMLSKDEGGEYVFVDVATS